MDGYRVNQDSKSWRNRTLPTFRGLSIIASMALLRFALFSLLAAVSTNAATLCGTVHDSETQKAVTPHETTRHDKAGPYSIGNSLPFAERNQLLSKARSFLWDHWSHQLLGQLQVTVYTIEGDPTTYVFFVEKDSRDRWCVRSESESVITRLLKPGEAPRRETQEVTYYEIDRLDSETNKIIQSAEKRPPDTYTLRLKSSKGP